MKTLVYTCNDLQHSLPCVDLLYSSLLKSNSTDSFDFAVLCNSTNHSKIDYRVLYDQSYPPQYMGFLKYSSCVPSGYDFYVYLDSDILFYSRLDEIFPSQEKDVSVGVEGRVVHGQYHPCNMIESDWHSYGYQDQIQSTGNHKPCVNAGQFAFTARSDFLSAVRANLEWLMKTHTDFSHLPSHYCAMYEQSTFNYSLISVWNTVDTETLTKKLSVCPEYESQTEKSIFHFTGFHDGMAHKAQRMINFIQHRGRNT